MRGFTVGHSPLAVRRYLSSVFRPPVLRPFGNTVKGKFAHFGVSRVVGQAIVQEEHAEQGRPASGSKPRCPGERVHTLHCAFVKPETDGQRLAAGSWARRATKT